MTSKEIEDFTRAASTILIAEIIGVDIIPPVIIFDYGKDANIYKGYYMYKNLSNTYFVLNMNSILHLSSKDIIRTVITYGLIHEIVHLFQPISSMYKINCNFYTVYEDSADYVALDLIKHNQSIIEKKLHFKINDQFIKGMNQVLIDREKCNDIDIYNNYIYYINTISGTLIRKLNNLYDCIYSKLYKLKESNSTKLRFIFPDQSEYHFDLLYSDHNELNILINLIILTDIRMIHIRIIDYNICEIRMI